MALKGLTLKEGKPFATDIVVNDVTTLLPNDSATLTIKSFGFEGMNAVTGGFIARAFTKDGPGETPPLEQWGFKRAGLGGLAFNAPIPQDGGETGNVTVGLGDLSVSDVMVHRTKMVSVNVDGPRDAVIEAILDSEYTRIPLWREKPENIIGVLHAKDLLRAIRTNDGDLSKIDVAALALPPWFVPEMRPLSEQLKAFRRRKTHFALVVDEYGEVEGLVTLEDILEEIVGDISDEHDVAVAGVRAQPDGSVVVDGSVPIRDLNRAMDWHLPDEEATTIAGLVIHEARSIPDRGQSFTFHGFRFRVLRRERNRITALRIVPLPRDSDVPEKKPRAGTAF